MCFRIVIVLFFSFLSSLHAQQCTIQLADTSIKEKDSKEFFYQLAADRYVLIHQDYNNNARPKSVHMAGYDAQLNTLYATELDEISGKAYKAGVVIDGHMTLFAFDDASYYKYTLSDDGKKIVKEELLFTPVKTGEAQLDFGVSADSNYYYLVATYRGKDGTNVEGVILNRGMKVLSKVNLMNALPALHVCQGNFIISNEGVLSIILQSNGKKANSDDPIQFFIAQAGLKAKKGAPKLLAFPDVNVHNISWQATGVDLNFTAFAGERGRPAAGKYFNGHYDGKTQKITDMQEHVVMKPENDTIKWDGFPPHAMLVNTYELPDESKYLVFEVTNSRNGWDYYLTLNAAAVQGKALTFFAYDVYVVKQLANGEIAWIRRIPKAQMAAAEKDYTGSVTLLDKNNNLFVIFHDNKVIHDEVKEQRWIYLDDLHMKRDEFCLNVVRFTPDGAVTKQYVDKPRDSQFYLTMNASLQVSPARLLLKALDFKGMGRSRYKLATISIQ